MLRATTSTLFPYTTLFRSMLPIPSDTPSSRPRTPEGGTLTRTASRFSVMWLDGSGTPHRAAIRGDGSIRDTDDAGLVVTRSEEHTSELQSRRELVCRLLLE